jgi:hypothetical protein
MDSFILEHTFHGLRKVLNAIIDGTILGMVDQSVKNMVVKDPCSQHLRDMGSFHPRDKVFFDGWAKIKGNIVKDHKSRKGVLLTFVKNNCEGTKLEIPNRIPLKVRQLCIH